MLTSSVGSGDRFRRKGQELGIDPQPTNGGHLVHQAAINNIPNAFLQ